MHCRTLSLGVVAFSVMGAHAMPGSAAERLRAGIIGCDTSHAIAFTKIFNRPDSEGATAAIQVTTAFPGGSPDIPASRDRVAKYTEELRGMGLEIVGSIDALLERVDVVLLESVDGRVHLDQARPVFAAGKPVFIDKPVAGSLRDAVEIFRLAAEHDVPCFSSSALRFSPHVIKLRTDSAVGEIIGCDAYSPCSLEPHHPDLFWYGVHGVELLFTVMGPGCEAVARVQTESTELAVGTWRKGRVGTFRGMRAGKRGYGATVYGTGSIQTGGDFAGYEPLLEQVAIFFQTGTPPVPASETLEIFAFMEAADESKRRGGTPVRLDEVLQKAGGQPFAARSAK